MSSGDINQLPNQFVYQNHLPIFCLAAEFFNCHILVRKTGIYSISWIGKKGYTGKRADLKAKTADRDNGRYKLAGLVCSPFIQPKAFSAERIKSAYEEWNKCQHLITVSNKSLGFSGLTNMKSVRTPYIVQTNPSHQHFGCVALVDMGLLLPRFIHGDYDLYAIIPAGKPFDPWQVKTRKSWIGSTMSPNDLTTEERVNLSVPNIESGLSFRIANFINQLIEKTSQDLLGALMINHGEQINIGEPGITYEPVLAVMPQAKAGKQFVILSNRADHEKFYQNA